MPSVSSIGRLQRSSNTSPAPHHPSFDHRLQVDVTAASDSPAAEQYGTSAARLSPSSKSVGKLSGTMLLRNGRRRRRLKEDAEGYRDGGDEENSGSDVIERNAATSLPDVITEGQQ